MAPKKNLMIGKPALKIALFQPVLPEYRIPVFAELSRRCGINLTIFYGQTSKINNAKPKGFKAIKSEVLRLNFLGPGFVFDFSCLRSALLSPHDIFIFYWDIHQL